MTTHKPMNPASKSHCELVPADESIDPHEIRKVLLEIRDIMGEIESSQLRRELRSVHDRIAEIQVVDLSPESCIPS